METTRQNDRRRWQRAVLWLLLVAGLALSFGHNFAEMWVRWFPAWQHSDWGLYDRLMEGESYYTHAPLVPFVSLIIAILLIRHTRIPVKPDRRWGAGVLVVSLLAHLLACLARVNFVSGFAFIGVLASLVLLLWGRRALRRLWFAIALLVFMVPMPEVSISQLNFRLKMFAADWGVRLSEFIGILVEREGNTVHLEGGKTLVIANVCNGLRTLISLLAFGALYAYVCRLRGWWRAFLFLCSVPVAVIANSVRVVTLIVVADIWNEKVATGWYHDFSGIFIFVLAFLLMFGLEKVILGAHKLVGRPVKVLPLFHGQLRTEQDAAQWPQMVQAGSGGRGLAAVALVGLSAVGAWWLNQTIPNPMTGAGNVLPKTVRADGREWLYEPRDLDEQTRVILENPDSAIHIYWPLRPGYRIADLTPEQIDLPLLLADEKTREAAERVDDPRDKGSNAPAVEVCVIFSKDNRKGIHPPDLCLEGGGQNIVEKDDVILPDVAGVGDVPFRSLIVHKVVKGDERTGRPPGTIRQLFLYTYKCGGRYTTSFWEQQYAIFMNGLLNRNASGALIRAWTLIQPTRTDPGGADPRTSGEAEAVAAAKRRAEAILQATLPQLHKNLP